MEDLIISKSQINVDKDVVTLDSPELIEGLILHNEEGLNALKSIGVNVNAISISKTGKLVIADRLFAERVKDKFIPGELIAGIPVPFRDKGAFAKILDQGVITKILDQGVITKK